MNILVTGANGQLGREMRIAAKGAADRYLFADVVQAEGLETIELDITDAAAVSRLVQAEGIGAIVNCAAYTQVDRAETDRERCALLNAEAPGILAGVMKENGGLLVHISTDYVFGKEPYNTPCSEDRQGTPTGEYGRTKLEGERRIAASGCRYIIIRTSWLYSEFGKNFCRTMLQLTATKPEVKVVFDQAGTPTYALDLAQAIFTILSERRFEGRTGIYHFSNEGVCSWYDFAWMTAMLAGHTSCRVLPCHSSEYPSPVVRPSYAVLDKTRIKAAFGLEIPYWVDSLRKCVRNLQQDTTSGLLK